MLRSLAVQVQVYVKEENTNKSRSKLICMGGETHFQGIGGLESGVVESQFLLAECYRRGDGVPQVRTFLAYNIAYIIGEFVCPYVYWFFICKNILKRSTVPRVLIDKGVPSFSSDI